MAVQPVFAETYPCDRLGCWQKKEGRKECKENGREECELSGEERKDATPAPAPSTLRSKREKKKNFFFFDSVERGASSSCMDVMHGWVIDISNLGARVFLLLLSRIECSECCKQR